MNCAKGCVLSGTGGLPTFIEFAEMPAMSMADRDGVIWLDGEMVPWRDAKVHVLTHTLHYGMGVFEGVRGCFRVPPLSVPRRSVPW